MLVLSRKVGESICIGNNIKIVVHRVTGHRVTIGIEAPNDIRIWRGELPPEDPREAPPSPHAAAPK